MKGIIDRFLNSLKELKNKLVRMVKGKDLPEKLRKELDEHPKSIISLYLQKREAKKTRKDHFKRNVFIIIVLVPISLLIPKYSDSYFPNINFINVWISVVLPFVILFLIELFAYRYGKIEKQKKIFTSGVAYCTMINLVYIYFYKFGLEAFIVSEFLILYLGFLGFSLAWILSHKFSKTELDLDFDNIKISYYRSNIQSERAKNLILGIASLLDVDVMNVPEYEDKNVGVYDIGDYLRLFINHVKNNVSIFILKETGKIMSQNEKCKELQNQLDLLLTNILHMEPVKKDEIKDALYEESFNLVEEYGKPIQDINIRENSKYIISIAIITIAIIGLIILFKYIPQEKKIETSSYILVSFVTAIITALILAFFGKK